MLSGFKVMLIINFHYKSRMAANKDTKWTIGTIFRNRNIQISLQDTLWASIVKRDAVGARVWEVFVFCREYVVFCLHPVTVLNAVFYMTFRFLILVEDGRGLLRRSPFK